MLFRYRVARCCLVGANCHRGSEAPGCTEDSRVRRDAHAPSALDDAYCTPDIGAPGNARRAQRATRRRRRACPPHVVFLRLLGSRAPPRPIAAGAFAVCDAQRPRSQARVP